LTGAGYLRIWGPFKLCVGILAVASSLFGMLRGLNTMTTHWWGPLTLVSAALLALEGISELLSRKYANLLVFLAAMVPIGIWVVFQESFPGVWIFSLFLAFLEWTIRRLSKITEQDEIGTLLLSLVLAASLANTTWELVRFYWDAPSFWMPSQIAGFMFPIVLPWCLILILIAHSASEILKPGLRLTETDPGQGMP
jgi:hypothetical protein